MCIRIDRKIFQIVLLATQLLWNAPAAAVSESPFAAYFHTGWMPSDGAPADVWGIVQDIDGWLWIGGSTGLYRFDGRTFERVEAIDGNKLHKSNVLSLAYLDGALWVGYATGGIERFKGGVATFFGPDSGLGQAGVHKIVQAPGGPVSLGTSSGLYEWNGKKWTRSWPQAGRSGETVYRLIVTSDGTLLINGGGAVLRRKKGAGTFSPIPSDVSDISSLFQGPGGSIWAVSPAGLQRYDAIADRIVGTSPALKKYANAMLYTERDGTPWMQVDAGLQLLGSLDGFSVVDEMTRARGLSDSNVQTFFQDREGNIWLGTSGGIDRLRRTKVHAVTLPADTHQPAVAPDDNGQVWISSRSGGPLRRFDAHGVGTDYTTLPSAELVMRGGDGTVWSANALNVGRYAHGKETLWPLPGRKDQFPQSMAQDTDGSLWLSLGGSHHLWQLRDGQWHAGDSLEAYRSTAILLHFDDRRRLWQTFPGNRIAVRDGTHVTRYTAKDGLDVGSVLSVSTRGGQLWIGGDQGLMFLKEGHFFPVTDGDGAPFMTVSAIVETADGDLWLHGGQGISHIKAEDVRRLRDGASSRVPVERINYTDGMLGQSPPLRPLPSMVEGPDGRLWYATRSSVGWIDPRHVLRNALVPPVKVRALTSDGIVHAPTPEVAWQLPPRTSNLRLDYTALTLTMPERVRFRYRLQGVDDTWIDAGTRRTAFYTNLGPGAYRFDVQAANEDGVWNTAGAHQGIVIAPAIVQTIWFRILCAVVLAFMLWLLYRWRLRQLSHRMRVRMDERLDERSRIARELHDTLLQSVQGLVLKIHGATQRLPAQEPVRGLLDAALTQAETTIADGRNRVQDLRTHEDGSHLLPLLKASGNAWAHGNGTEFTVGVDGEPRLLAAGVGSEVLAICREAMSNAFRHAQAGHVDVTIGFGANALQVTVSDDGVGIPVDTITHGRSGHFGLVGMRERATRLGGTWTVQPRPDGGTMCVLVLPAALAYALKQARWWQ